MLCFKFNQNRTINEEFYFWGITEEGLIRFEKYGYASYRMVVPLHTGSFITLAQLESVENSGNWNVMRKKERPIQSIFGDFESVVKTSIIDILTCGFL